MRNRPPQLAASSGSIILQMLLELMRGNEGRVPVRRAAVEETNNWRRRLLHPRRERRRDRRAEQRDELAAFGPWLGKGAGVFFCN